MREDGLPKRSPQLTMFNVKEGFRITEKLAGIATAIMGEAGEGGPVIAILGEYDALPGLFRRHCYALSSPLSIEPGRAQRGGI